MKVEYIHYSLCKTPLSEAEREKTSYIPTLRHGVKLGVLGDQPGQVLDAVQGRGGAAGLQDEPSPRDEHRALGQHVGVHLGEQRRGQYSSKKAGEAFG